MGGFTMLHWAAGKGKADFCSYLIDLEADPHAQDCDGRTPLDCARQAGHGKLQAQLLAPSGAGMLSSFPAEGGSVPSKRGARRTHEPRETLFEQLSDGALQSDSDE